MELKTDILTLKIFLNSELERIDNFFFNMKSHLKTTQHTMDDVKNHLNFEEEDWWHICIECKFFDQTPILIGYKNFTVKKIQTVCCAVQLNKFIITWRTFAGEHHITDYRLLLTKYKQKSKAIKFFFIDILWSQSIVLTATAMELAVRKFSVGEIVFVKIKGYPPWPSTITQFIKNRVKVVFFGWREQWLVLIL